MNSVAISLLVFGIYFIVNGLGFAFAPNFFLGLLRQPEATEPYIRIAGALLLAIGFYYIQVARTNLRSFYMWTVQARVVVFLLFILFTLLKWAPPILYLFAAFELIGAMWTFFAYRATSQSS
jgi:uncharacterized protein YjeT (DUF2065 family)